MNKTPKISIITVVYNGVCALEATMLSIFHQSCDNIEYLVIDGASIDGTVDLIKQYDARCNAGEFPNISFRWISETDEGIYNAMNKGIKMAAGDWLLFINEGDFLRDIKPFFDIIKKNGDADLIAFPVELSSGTIFHPQFNWQIKTHNTLPHQGLFYRRELDVFYNEKFKVFADFDLNLKLFKQKADVIFGKEIIALHSLDGVSNDKRVAEEVFSVIQDNYGIFYRVLSILYFKYKGFVCRIKRLFS